MLLDDGTADVVLRIIYQMARARPGVSIRSPEVSVQTSIDPAVVFAAIEQLVKAKMLLPGSTHDQVCLSPAAVAWIRSHPLAA